MKDTSTSADADDELAIGIWDGDPSTFAKLIREHLSPIQHYIRKRFPSLRAQAEDIASDAFARAYQYRDRFKAGAKPRPWLIKIAHNCALDMHTRQKADQKAREEVSAELRNREERDRAQRRADRIETGEPKVIKNVRECLDAIGEPYRSVLMAYSECGEVEPDAATIGREVGRIHDNGVPRPAATIRKQRERGQKKLEAELRKRGIDANSLGRTR
ncbi:MAG: sigma-70 family RNA polymerase sigma factor [Planctomycetota bacterium]